MPAACLNSWQTDACQWSIGYVWRSSDWIERGIFVALLLMLAYTVFALGRFSRRYYLGRRESRALISNSCLEFQQSQKNLVADLSRGLRILQAIGSAAPFLGLAGTSYGILAALFRGFGASRSSVLAYLSTSIPAPLISAAAGILVAMPAIVSHNILRRRIEVLLSKCSFSIRDRAKDERGGTGSFQYAQTLPLKSRFSSLPPFALLAAPALACVVALLMPFHPYRIPTGLRVLLPSFPCQPDVLPDRIIVLRVTKSGDLFINMEPVSWTDLPHRLSAIYRTRARRDLYLRSDDGATFQTVAEAIDTATKIRAPEFNSLDINVLLITPQAEADSEKCFVVRVDRFGRQFLRK